MSVSYSPDRLCVIFNIHPVVFGRSFFKCIISGISRTELCTKLHHFACRQQPLTHSNGVEDTTKADLKDRKSMGTAKNPRNYLARVICFAAQSQLTTCQYAFMYSGRELR